MPATKHQKSRIGLTKALRINADNKTPNPFSVYGDSIGKKAKKKKTVTVKDTKDHRFTSVTPSDPNDDRVDISVICECIKHTRGTDDLTVTIVIDDGDGNPDTTECTFTDVIFDDPPP
jgi:hypothetical protein